MEMSREYSNLVVELKKIGADTKEKANLVVRYFGPACTLAGCFHRVEMAGDILDKLDFALKAGDTAEDILKAAGVLQTA